MARVRPSFTPSRSFVQRWCHFGARKRRHMFHREENIFSHAHGIKQGTLLEGYAQRA